MTAGVWWQAIRPKTLWASVVPVIIGASMASCVTQLDLLTLWAIVFAALLIQISSNLANDLFDFLKGADSSRTHGPVRVTQAGLVSPAEVRNALVLTIVLATLVGIFLVWQGGLPILIIGVLSLVCAVLYTGGPLPLAYHGLGDVFVFVFFGPVAVAGTYYLLTSEMANEVWIASIAPGALSVAILVVNNLRDLEADRAVAKNTLAVRFGPLFTRVQYTVMLSVAASVPGTLWILEFGSQKILIASAFLLFAFPLVRSIWFEPIGPGLNLTLAGSARLLLIYGLLFSLGWIA